MKSSILKQITPLKIFLLILLLSSISCDSSAKLRHYEETTAQLPQASRVDPHAGMTMNVSPDMQTNDPSIQSMLTDSVAAVDLKWETPIGWREQKGTGMRLVSFQSEEADPITCTVISLSGRSGGIQANIQRWMRQIQLEVSAEEFQSFISNVNTIQSTGGLMVKKIDFGSLQNKADTNQPSMMAGIIELDDRTIFVKMTGSLQAINQNDQAFQTLITSLRVE